MAHPKVYADFQNADSKGRLRLNTVGTQEDLSRQHIRLHDGLVLTVYAEDEDARGQTDELRAEGVVSYSEDERCWVATIDWSAIRHASDEIGDSVNGAPDVATPAQHRLESD